MDKKNPEPSVTPCWMWKLNLYSILVWSLGNAALTSIFKCDDSKTCCSPKTAIKERELVLKRINSNKKNVIYSSIDRNDSSINSLESQFFNPDQHQVDQFGMPVNTISDQDKLPAKSDLIWTLFLLLLSEPLTAQPFAAEAAHSTVLSTHPRTPRDEQVCVRRERHLPQRSCGRWRGRHTRRMVLAGGPHQLPEPVPVRRSSHRNSVGSDSSTLCHKVSAARHVWLFRIWAPEYGAEGASILRIQCSCRY